MAPCVATSLKTPASQRRSVLRLVEPFGCVASHPASLTVRPLHPCSGVRRMRLTLPSLDIGESGARARPRRFGFVPPLRPSHYRRASQSCFACGPADTSAYWRSPQCCSPM